MYFDMFLYPADDQSQLPGMDIWNDQKNGVNFAGAVLDAFVCLRICEKCTLEVRFCDVQDVVIFDQSEETRRWPNNGARTLSFNMEAGCSDDVPCWYRFAMVLNVRNDTVLIDFQAVLEQKDAVLFEIEIEGSDVIVDLLGDVVVGEPDSEVAGICDFYVVQRDADSDGVSDDIDSEDTSDDAFSLCSGVVLELFWNCSDGVLNRFLSDRCPGDDSGEELTDAEELAKTMSEFATFGLYGMAAVIFLCVGYNFILWKTTKGVDQPNFRAIFSFFFAVLDLWTDVIFCVSLVGPDTEFLFYAALAFLIIPMAASFAYLVKFVREKKAQEHVRPNGVAVTLWLSKYMV